MALYSMTGFGRGQAENDEYFVAVEIKSVNHRFKDTRFKMSSIFNSIEMDLKNELFKHIKRGSFDIYVNFKRSEKNSKFEDIDESKVKDFVSLIKSYAGNEAINFNATDFLKNEFLKDQDLSQDKELMRLTNSAYKDALEGLLSSRKEEGTKLKKVIEDHLSNYVEHFSKIEGQTKQFQENVEIKLRKRFEEYQSEMKVDEPRFMQEVIFYLEKLDVHEEINRIKSHIDKLKNLVSSNKEIGRQLDFMVQELNRETNTIGSKSSVEEISDSVVQMKVQLEKIREQGLNLE